MNVMPILAQVSDGCCNLFVYKETGAISMLAWVSKIPCSLSKLSTSRNPGPSCQLQGNQIPGYSEYSIIQEGLGGVCSWKGKERKLGMCVRV